ncbi:hypothetical protein FKP32DRAFT_903582 [Trametes sanguinea]|nr:hypothetical protein FKP32DRAFT_903582 [Trametes sanguinea]
MICKRLMETCSVSALLRFRPPAFQPLWCQTLTHCLPETHPALTFIRHSFCIVEHLIVLPPSHRMFQLLHFSSRHTGQPASSPPSIDSDPLDVYAVEGRPEPEYASQVSFNTR